MIHKKDSKVNNILKEYNLLKDLIQKIPDFNNIKTRKLNTYIDIFEQQKQVNNLFYNNKIRFMNSNNNKYQFIILLFVF